MTEEIIGRVVLSRAGRDKGRAFIVTGVADDGRIYVADGGLRPLEKPKKKNLRHVAFRPERVELAEITGTGDRGADNSRLRKSLERLGDHHDDECKEG